MSNVLQSGMAKSTIFYSGIHALRAVAAIAVIYSHAEFVALIAGTAFGLLDHRLYGALAAASRPWFRRPQPAG